MPLDPGAIKKRFASRTGAVLALIWLCATLSSCLHRPSSQWRQVMKGAHFDNWVVEFFEDTGPRSHYPFVSHKAVVSVRGKIFSEEHDTWKLPAITREWLFLEGESFPGGGASYHDLYIVGRTGSVQRITFKDGIVSFAFDPPGRGLRMRVSDLYFSGGFVMPDGIHLEFEPTARGDWQCTPAANRGLRGDARLHARCAEEMAEAGDFASMGRAVVPLLVAGAWDEAARLIEARLLLMQPQVDEPIPLDQVVPDILADLSIDLGREDAFILDLLRGHAEAWSNPYQAAYLTRLAQHMAKSEGP